MEKDKRGAPTEQPAAFRVTVARAHPLIPQTSPDVREQHAQSGQSLSGRGLTRDLLVFRQILSEIGLAFPQGPFSVSFSFCPGEIFFHAPVHLFWFVSAQNFPHEAEVAAPLSALMKVPGFHKSRINGALSPPSPDSRCNFAAAHNGTRSPNNRPHFVQQSRPAPQSLPLFTHFISPSTLAFQFSLQMVN